MNRIVIQEIIFTWKKEPTLLFITTSLKGYIREFRIINIITITVDLILNRILITVCYSLNCTKKFIKFFFLNIRQRWSCIKHNIENRNIKLLIANISVVKPNTPMNFTIDVHPENTIRWAWWRLSIFQILINHLLNNTLIISTEFHWTLLICKSQLNRKHRFINYFIDF